MVILKKVFKVCEVDERCLFQKRQIGEYFSAEVGDFELMYSWILLSGKTAIFWVIGRCFELRL